MIDFSYLLQPLPDGSPCGPDLDVEGDPEYFNFLIPAESRLPNSFFDSSGKNLVGDLVFDRSAIDLEGEARQVGALLARSRDLRLLALLAQFHSAMSDLAGFADCLAAIQGLVEERWEDVHPAAADGDFSLRMVSVEALDDRIRVAIPLSFFPLVRDKKIGVVSFRSLDIALRPETKRDKETALPLADVQEALRSESARATLVETLAIVKKCADSLTSIRAVFREKTDFANVPSFDNTIGVLEEMRKAVAQAVPGLLAEGGAVENADGEPESGRADAGSGQIAGKGAATVDVAAAGPLIAVSGHAHARQLLGEAEKYFSAFEPSSPALMLVHQARALVGKPLVEALEAIAPAHFDAARISVDAQSGLSIGFERMRQLSASIHGAAIAAAPDEPAAAPLITRREAMTAMLSVEAFLAGAEPSSPTPLLLAKARAFMSKSFSEVMKELLAEPRTQT